MMLTILIAMIVVMLLTILHVQKRFVTSRKQRHFCLNNVYADNFDSHSSDLEEYLKKCLVPEYLFTSTIAWFNNILCSSFLQVNLKLMCN